MKLADFQLRPHPDSPRHIRIRIWDTQAAMEAVAIAEGSMTGNAQACHCGFGTRDEPRPRCLIGHVYLYDGPDLRTDAVHELTHAAVHYAREIRRGDLQEPNVGEHASGAEELLCETMEHYVIGFCVELEKRRRRMANKLAKAASQAAQT